MSGLYIDTFGERFTVEAVPSYGARQFYLVASVDDGSQFRASETLIREWVAVGYFEATRRTPRTCAGAAHER